MPAFLVQLPENRRVQGVNVLSVFAADAAGARRAASMQFDGDAAGLWNTVATVTEVVVGLLLSDAGDGWSVYTRVSGAAGQTVGFDPFVVDVNGLDRNPAEGRLITPRKHVGAADPTINDGGSGYSIDDILTLSGGTFTRAATFRVITVSTGAISAIELVDPGEYSVLPSLSTFVHTGASTDADLDTVAALEGSYEALLAQALTGLLGSPDITGATLDMSEGASGARLLTAASGGGGDDLGDGTFEFEVRQNGVEETVLTSTITHEGASTAVLSVAIPASPLAPPRVSRFQARV